MEPADIRKLHEALGRDCSSLLAQNVSVEPVGEDGWHRVPVSAKVEFRFCPGRDCLQDHTDRGRGDVARTVPLLGPIATDMLSESAHWVSWFERWKKTQADGFKLLTASWTVFLGIYGQRKKAQLLRADWDQLDSEVGQPDSGHPHWHLDALILAESGPETVSTAALRECPPRHSGAPEEPGLAPGLSIDQLHLAMGTWHEGKDHPECWQRPAANCGEIRSWGARTLEYLQSQFRKL